MNPSNTVTSSPSPLVDDFLESKVGLSPPDDPLQNHKSALYPQMTLQRTAFLLQMTPSTADQHLQPTLVNALLESKVGPPPPDDPFKGHLQLNCLMVKSGYLR